MVQTPYTENENKLPQHTLVQLQKAIEPHMGEAHMGEAHIMGETFPALSIAVIHRGDVVLDAGWGWIDPDTKHYPVTPKSVFDLASVTKPFTATAFLSLVEAGKAAIDDALVSVVPEFAELNPRSIDGGQDPFTKENLPALEALQGHTVDPETVTFRHLLNHTSGLAPWRAVYMAAGEVPTPPEVPDPITRDVRWSRAVDALCQYPFVDDAGNKVRYSDLGMMLLGEAVSRLHGTPGELDKAIQTRVFNPLGLASLAYNPVRSGVDRNRIPPTENDPGWRGRRCWGEVHDENASGVGGVAGHAGLFGQAMDVARFGQAWLARDARLGISKALMDEAVTHQVGGQDSFRLGYCWMLRAYEGSSAGDLFSVNTFGHTGFTGTSLWVDPDNALVVACLTNRVYPGREKVGIHAFRQAVHTILAEGLFV